MSHQARKRFGQNFLQDQGVIGRIVRSINPQPGENLLEIGPGQAAITKPLLQACGRLQVVELDRDLIEPLRQSCVGLGELIIHNADALRFNFAPLGLEQPLRLVGNLPYNISTPLLFHLLEQSARIADMHFMLQKEVVERMAAEPGGKDYGRLTVMLQARCRVTHLFDIGPGAFKPAPKVDSAFVRLQPHGEPLYPIADFAAFGRLVAAAFSQRRKTLRNGLKGLLDEGQIQAAGVDPQARAETLSVAAFARLSAQLLAPLHSSAEIPNR
ncbi:MAG: 16S rRNA (adenine(1518)-N(6)/adenine(1519)-N(6))-dimethyltransferase RsmA [Gammaproteobacteria bacterium]|nr:16S rRNA (adenine(1518)-N(6)/adenine(1519)-N(6))-dimethyltransferase RsmA [Gammaproteobacteria bacterium]